MKLATSKWQLASGNYTSIDSYSPVTNSQLPVTQTSKGGL
jgi:hypothetical protein